MKRFFRTIIICLLITAIVFSLTGCKECLNITQVLYDQKQEDVDKDNETKITQENPDTGENTDELAEKIQGKSARKTDEQPVPAKRSELDSNQPAVNTQQADNANDDAGNDGTNGESDTEDPGQSEDGDENQSDESTPNSDGESSEDPGTGDADQSADSATKRQIYNDDGGIVELPEYVNSVVAADEAGAMAVMLGGDGILAGTSASLTEDTLLAVPVLGKGLSSNAQTYWSGSGSSPMSEENFKVLIENKPDVCVYVTGKNSFNGDQLARLQEAGIACVALPALSSDENICKAMGILAEVIGNRTSSGGKNAEKVAADYEDYCKSLVERVNNNVPSSSSVATLYLSGWDNNAELLMTDGNGNVLVQEYGLGIAKNAVNENPLQYYLAASKVINNAFELSAYRGGSYAAIPLNINLFSGNTNITGGSVQAYSRKNESFVRYFGKDKPIGLGDQQFPCVITNSQATRNALLQSKSAEYGIWSVYGKSTVGNATDYGFVAYNQLIRTWVHGDYQIYVNPYGVTSWTDGSAESVLESVWAAYQINGGYSKSDMKAEIQAFYQKFYGYSLSDSEIELILEGK